MPPKKPSKPNPDTPTSPRVTRSRHASTSGPPVGLFSIDEELQRRRHSLGDTGPEPQAGTSTGSDSRVWFADFDDITDDVFARGLDITSTQVLPIPAPGTLPPPVHRAYSPTEFDAPDLDNTQAFRTANEMSDDERGAGGGGHHTPLQPVAPPPADPMAMIAFLMQRMTDQADEARQQRIDDAAIRAAELKVIRDEQAARDRKHDDELKNRAAELKLMFDANEKKDKDWAETRKTDRDREANLRKESADAVQVLADEVKRLATRRPGSPRPSHLKLPSFDLERDKDSFKQWHDRYRMHIKAHRIHLVVNVDERNERALTELTSALSNATLQWIANRDFTPEDRKDPDALIAAFEAYIKDQSNPTVTVVELFTMKRYTHESADALHARINEKLNKVDFSVITDIRDYFGMTATIIANDPVLRKQMYLDKVDTYAKAHAATKADEQATSHSKMINAATSSSSTSAVLDSVSSYKRGQNQTNQRNASSAEQSHRGNSSGQTRDFASFSRGGNRGGYQGNQYRGRGGFASSNSRPQSPDRSDNRDRGRSASRDQTRDQSHARSQSTSSYTSSDTCQSCGKSGHPRKECWAFSKICTNCGRPRHIAPACRQPPKGQSASGVSTSFLEGTLGGVTATYKAPRESSTLLEGWLGSITGVATTTEDLLLAPAVKWDREVLAIEKSNNVTVSLKALGSEPFDVIINIDHESNLTAIPASTAGDIPLFDTDSVLHTADGSSWPVLGSFYAQLRFGHHVKVEKVFVAEGLPLPLLAADMLQELGLPHSSALWASRTAPTQDSPSNPVAVDKLWAPVPSGSSPNNRRFQKRKATAYELHQVPNLRQASEPLQQMAPETSQELELAPHLSSTQTNTDSHTPSTDQRQTSQAQPSTPPQLSTRKTAVPTAAGSSSPSQSGRKGLTLLPAGEASSGRKRMTAPSSPSDPSRTSTSSITPTPRLKRPSAPPIAYRPNRPFLIRAAALKSKIVSAKDTPFR